MRNYFAGFLVGFVAAGAIFVILNVRNEVPSASAGNEAAPGVISDFAAADAASQPTQAQTPQLTTGSGSVPASGQAREQQLRSLIAESRAAIDEYSAQLRSLEATNRRNDQAIVSPLALPPDFGWLSASAQWTEYDAIQRENRDVEWAATTESQLRAYFAERPEIAEEFGYPVIECRTSRCGVAFARHGVDANQRDMNLRFDDLVSDWVEQPWRGEFPNVAHLVSNNAGGVHSIYWSLINQDRSLDLRRAR